MNNGILKVSEESRKTIDAVSVRLHITIQGENFVFGNAAIEKCQDVKLAVTKIVALDGNSTITIDGVTIKSETGWFTKGSKGDYRITVKLGEMGKVNDVLGAIMELKNASMDSLEWEYDEYTAKVLLIEESVKRCKHKAEVMATALEKTIVGIKTCSDSYEVPDDNIQTNIRNKYPSLDVRARRSVAVPGDFGTEVKGKKEISAVATIEFYLSNSGSV
jgi:Protein of unknown function (DUF541)